MCPLPPPRAQLMRLSELQLQNATAHELLPTSRGTHKFRRTKHISSFQPNNFGKTCVMLCHVTHSVVHFVRFHRQLLMLLLHLSICFDMNKNDWPPTAKVLYEFFIVHKYFYLS